MDALDKFTSPRERAVRLRAPQRLRSKGIPCVVWLEDAAQRYGAPTGLFDLYIVVPDLHTAARVLEAGGWEGVQQDVGRIMNSMVRSPQLRLHPSKAEPVHSGLEPVVVLLPADVWSSDFAKHEERYSLPDDYSFYPSLSAVVDGFIDVLLGGPDELRRPVSVNLGYLYHYVPDLKERSFAGQLRRDNRQFHHDLSSGMRLGTIPFYTHEREIREEIRSGAREISERSASETDNPKLYSAPVRPPPP